MLHYTRLERLARGNHSNLLDPFVSCENNSVVNMTSGTISTTLLFFATYEWAQKVRVLHYTVLERLARDNHSSLLDPFVICKENKVL